MKWKELKIMANPIVQNQYNHSIDIIKKSDSSQTEVYSCTYSPYMKHRDGTRTKSQWDAAITQDKEFELFKNSLAKEWVKVEEFKFKKDKYQRLLSPDGRGWGLFVEDGEAKELGTLNDGETKVKVCVFEEGNPNLWHGYPANLKNRQDRPLDHVLKKWRDAKYITKAVINKVKKGQLSTI